MKELCSIGTWFCTYHALKFLFCCCSGVCEPTATSCYTEVQRGPVGSNRIASRVSPLSTSYFSASVSNSIFNTYRKQLIPKEKMVEIAKTLFNTLTIEDIKVLLKTPMSIIMNKIILDECSTVVEIDHVRNLKDCLERKNG